MEAFRGLRRGPDRFRFLMSQLLLLGRLELSGGVEEGVKRLGEPQLQRGLVTLSPKLKSLGDFYFSPTPNIICLPVASSQTTESPKG